MGIDRSTPDLPDLDNWQVGDYIRSLRESRGLSRPQAAARLEVSVGLLEKVEGHSRTLTDQVLEACVDVFGMSSAQRQYAKELRDPPSELPPVDDLREYVMLQPTEIARLRGLEPHAAAVFDVRWHLLAANEAYRRVFPGLDGNVLLWWFRSPLSKRVVVDWETQARWNVRWARFLLSRFKHQAWAKDLFSQLCESPDFVRFWCEDNDVVFGRDEADAHMSLRELVSGRPFRLLVQTSEVHGRYTTRFFLGIREEQH